jgi:hypothetical protein
MTAMVDQTQAAMDAVGIADVVHCIVVPYMHRFVGVPFEQWESRMIANRNGAYTVASRRENVCAISIFDATDGVLFNGSDVAKAWLIEHGYDEFTYGQVTVDLANGPPGGDLLDAIVLHPGSDDAAAFFASIVGDQIAIGAQPADCDGNGALNVLDFVCFQNAWQAQQPEGDCDGDGEFDVLDFVCFQNRFNAPCG